MYSIYRLICRNCSRRTFLNKFLILCILCIIICLIINYKLNVKTNNLRELHDNSNIELMIDRIQSIQILNETYLFNITHEIKIDGIPIWINYYNISHLFDFYWLHTGGYKWHLQRMLDLQYISISKQIHSYDHSYSLNDINLHPEYGIIIDTAPDPFPLILPPLPRTSLSLNKICIRLGIANHWYPCYTRTNMISTISKSLFTYALYDITIGDSSSEIIHYDEIIYLFDNKLETINETFFITQILPRLIRLLAFVPDTAVILSPYFNSEIKYVNEYMDVLFQRGLIKDKNRLIKYNSTKTYQAHAIYSTSSPRSDLILLHHILIESQSSTKRELILIIRDNFDGNNYIEITQIINLFEFPYDFRHLRIHEYNEKSYNLTEISELFQKSMIVIGMPSHRLSHIVWCLPGTHIIEIGQKNMTTDYYEMSLQLKLNYWLALTTTTNNQIDVTDFRNLMMKVFTYIDV